MRTVWIAAVAATAVATCARQEPWLVLAQFSGEAHLATMDQLTFGSGNAEAHFSQDGNRIDIGTSRARRISAAPIGCPDRG
jgi:hypothetical protein